MNDDNAYRLLELVLQHGTDDKLRKLLDQGVKANAKNSNGMTALIYAAKHNKLEKAQILLEYGADPNHADIRKDTALIWAACLGHTDMVRLLLKYDADMDVTNNVGTGPLEGARRLNRTEVVTILLDEATKKAQDPHRNVLRYPAAGGNDIDALSHKAIKFSRDNDGKAVKFQFNQRAFIVNQHTPPTAPHESYGVSAKGDTLNLTFYKPPKESRLATLLRKLR